MSTLIEKLEQEIESLENSFEQFAIVNDEIAMVHTATIAGLKMAINIVKQHSEWISVDERLPTENDGRVSWGVNAYKKYILVNIVSRRVAMTCRFNLTDKCFETADKVTHWQPLPQPPIEVKP